MALQVNLRTKYKSFKIPRKSRKIFHAKKAKFIFLRPLRFFSFAILRGIIFGNNEVRKKT